MAEQFPFQPSSPSNNEAQEKPPDSLVSKKLNLELLREQDLFSPESTAELQNYIRKNGWVSFINCLGADRYHGIDIIQHVLYRMGDYEMLPDAALADAIEKCSNAFIRESLLAHRHRRNDINTYADKANPNELIRFLRHYDVPYLNIEVLNRRFTELSKANVEIVMSAIQKQASWEADAQNMVGNDGQSPRQLTVEMMRLSPKSLEKRIHYAFKFDALVDYVQSTLADPDDEEEQERSDLRERVFENIYPTEEALVALFKQSIRQNEVLYDTLQQYVRGGHKDSYVDQKDRQLSAQVFPILLKCATEAHPDSLELQMVFMNNCVIKSLSIDTYLLANPHGVSFEVIVAPKSKELGNDQIPSVSRINFLAAQSVEGNRATGRGIASALLSNWNSFPLEIQEEAKSYGFKPIQLQSHSTRMFEWVLEEVENRGYATIFPPAFINKISQYYNDQLGAAFAAVEMAEIVDAQYLGDYLTHEYGHNIIEPTKLNTVLRHISPDLLEQVEQKLGVSFKELDSRESLSIFSYLANLSAVEFDDVCSTLNGKDLDVQSARDKIRTVVSLQQHGISLEDLKRLDAMENDVYKKAVYAKYARLVESTRELKSIVDREKVGDDAISHISTALLRKADKLIVTHPDVPAEAIHELELINENIQVFIATFKTLRSKGSLALEAIVGTSLEVHAGRSSSLSEDDKETILAFQQDRYASKYSPELKEALVASLTSALENPNARFYIYRKDGKILSYVRFESDPAKPDSLHMASFMTNPQYEGGSIGQAMLEVALKKELERGLPIHAECDPSLVPFYAKYGFQEVPGGRYEDHGAETCKIVLNPTK